MYPTQHQGLTITQTRLSLGRDARMSHLTLPTIHASMKMKTLVYLCHLLLQLVRRDHDAT